MQLKATFRNRPRCKSGEKTRQATISCSRHRKLVDLKTCAGGREYTPELCIVGDKLPKTQRCYWYEGLVFGGVKCNHPGASKKGDIS